MGLLTDIKKRWNSSASNSIDGSQARSRSIPRGRSSEVSRSQQHHRPQALNAGSESQDSGVIIVHKDSNPAPAIVPSNGCPNCAAAAAARSNLTRPSLEHMKAFSSSRPQPMSDMGRTAEVGHDHSRPGTGYSSQFEVPPIHVQHHHHHHNQNQNHDPGFSSRPLSWGRRATTENVGQDVPTGYQRPVTPPYSIRSEQTGWNSGQQYNNMHGSNVPGPASHDGDFSQRPTSWRRATASHMDHDADLGHFRSYSRTSQNSRANSEAGPTHPRNTSKNMENTAYQAGYRDGKYSSKDSTMFKITDACVLTAIARLKADADRW